MWLWVISNHGLKISDMFNIRVLGESNAFYSKMTQKKKMFHTITCILANYWIWLLTVKSSPSDLFLIRVYNEKAPIFETFLFFLTLPLKKIITMSASFAVPANLHATKTEENGTDGQTYSIKAGLAQMLKVCLY